MRVTCRYCTKETDLRPYGPRGALVCFACAMESPDRKAETERQFCRQLEAAENAPGSGPVVIGHAAGPFRLGGAA